MKIKLKKVLVELRPSKKVLGEIGVFAVRNINIGTVLFKSDTNEEVFITQKEYDKLDPILQSKLLRFSAWDERGYSVDPKVDFNEMSTSYYLNHSCDGNLGFEKNGDFVAIKNIKKGDELSYDYGLIEMNPNFKMKCKCGSKICRGIITGNDWKNKTFQKLNLVNMYPDLKKAII